MTKEKCKRYIKPNGLNFCMSSVCPEKDCIYALANKLHQTIDCLEQENKTLKEKFEQYKSLKQKSYETLQKRLNDVKWEKRKLEQENKELKEEIRFHNKENSNLLAERNAAQIGYDEIREVKEHYRSALEEINRVVKLAHKVEDYSLGQDYTDLVDRIKKEVIEVLNA